jgi:hypothetical protein
MHVCAKNYIKWKELCEVFKMEVTKTENKIIQYICPNSHGNHMQAFLRSFIQDHGNPEYKVDI